MLGESRDDVFEFNARNYFPCGGDGCFVGMEQNVDIPSNSLGESDHLIDHSTMYDRSFEKDADDLVPYVGQTFKTDEEAYTIYCNFAKQNGFSVRRSHSLGAENHRLGFYRRKYVCHRAESPRPKAKVPEENRQRNRKSSRCKCAAKMMISKDVINGITEWRVIEFDNIHNHELLKQNEVRLLPAYRHISSLDQERIMTLSKAGCTMKVIMRILELEKGVEPGLLPFTERDVRNLVFSKSYVAREDDAMGLPLMCKKLKDQDAAFCYDYKLDENQKLEQIIWSFGNSTRAYASFGDVVVFDTTYRINRYDMPLGVWVGIDNHGNSIFFGCVLMRNEKTLSFQWALQVGLAVSTRNLSGEEANMRQKVHNSMLKTCMPIEEHASEILTPYAFKLLQEEMVLSQKYALIEMGCDLYVVRHCSKTEGGRWVTWIESTEEIFCSCKKFEFRGILCRHAIRVLVAKNYFYFPENYLITRWKRESSLVLKFCHNIRASGEHQSQMFHSHVALLQAESSKTKERAAFVETELERVIALVRSVPTDVENSGDDLERHALEDISNDINIKNSDQSKTKGRPKAKRPIGGVEAAKKARYCKVPNCGGTGHDSRNCPNK